MLKNELLKTNFFSSLFLSLWIRLSLLLLANAVRWLYSTNTKYTYSQFRHICTLNCISNDYFWINCFAVLNHGPHWIMRNLKCFKWVFIFGSALTTCNFVFEVFFVDWTGWLAVECKWRFLLLNLNVEILTGSWFHFFFFFNFWWAFHVCGAYICQLLRHFVVLWMLDVNWTSNLLWEARFVLPFLWYLNQIIFNLIVHLILT